MNMRMIGWFVGLVSTAAFGADPAPAGDGRDWHRSALRAAKPDGELLRQTIGASAKPNVLERWWNGHRVRWLDEGGTLQADDLRGDLLHSVLQVDLNGDGVYDGPGDVTVKWCDTDGDGVPDVQAVLVGPKDWDAQKQAFKDPGQWAVMLNHDRRGVLWWVDWQAFDFHHGCWAKTGLCAWLANYHGNNDFVKTCTAPDRLADPRLAWENPFSFYDEDGDGVSEMAIRWAAPTPSQGGRVVIPPALNMAHVTYDLDNNSGKGQETSYDMTLCGIGAAVDIRAMRHPLPHFAGDPKFDPCFHHNEWRRLTELCYMDRAQGYGRFFQTRWKKLYFVFDEDGDDHRWERVEMYFPTAGPSGHPQADSLGDRGEFDLDNSGGGRLYIGRFDHKLHLFGAEWGVWLVDKDAAFHGGVGAQSGRPRAAKVAEVVRYSDTDHDGFCDTIEYDYDGDRKIDFKVCLLDYPEGAATLPKAELIEPEKLGWQGLHLVFNKLAEDSWQEALQLYRAAWRRGWTTPEIDTLAAAASLMERYQKAYWIKEQLFRLMRARVLARLQAHPEEKARLDAYVAAYVKAYYLGDFAQLAGLVASCPDLDSGCRTGAGRAP